MSAAKLVRGSWRSRLVGSLTVRLVVSAVAVALAGYGVTLGVAYQLVRSATVTQSRTVLHSTAGVVAKAPAVERAASVRDLDRGLGRSVRLVLVRDDGSTVPSRATLPPAVLDAVSADRRGADRFRSDGKTYLVEAVSASGGDTVVAFQNYALVRASVLRVFDRMLLAAGLGALLAAGLGALAADRIVRPLRNTSSLARRMAAGERGIPAPVAPVLNDVAAIDSALIDLDAALRTSEGRQREFLLSVSHEIRTPLTGTRGHADALTDGLIAGPAVKEAGRTIAAETVRLDAFVADLLELARLEADDFRIRPSQFEVGDLVGQALAAWRPTADRASVVIKAKVTPVTCVSDPMRVRQLLDGLLENALRVAPPASVIRVVVEPDDADSRLAVRLQVADDGPGLDRSDIADAFTRGALADRHRGDRPVGTGLGLSIARRLVERLNGTITATSPPGGGATFTILVPRVERTTTTP